MQVSNREDQRELDRLRNCQREPHGLMTVVDQQGGRGTSATAAR